MHDNKKFSSDKPPYLKCPDFSRVLTTCFDQPIIYKSKDNRIFKSVDEIGPDSNGCFPNSVGAAYDVNGKGYFTATNARPKDEVSLCKVRTTEKGGKLWIGHDIKVGERV